MYDINCLTSSILMIVWFFSYFLQRNQYVVTIKDKTKYFSSNINYFKVEIMQGQTCKTKKILNKKFLMICKIACMFHLLTKNNPWNTSRYKGSKLSTASFLSNSDYTISEHVCRGMNAIAFSCKMLISTVDLFSFGM